MTIHLRFDSIAVGVSAVLASLLGSTTTIEASVVIDDLHRSVSASSMYAVTSLWGTEKAEADDETSAFGFWGESVAADVKFASSDASQQTVVMPGPDFVLVGGVIGASGSGSPPSLTLAEHAAASTISMTFTIESSKQFLLSGSFMAALLGESALDTLPFISLSQLGREEPIAFVDFAFGTTDRPHETNFELTGQLDPGTYVFDVNISVAQSQFAMEPIVFGQAIYGEFLFGLPAPGTIVLLVVAGAIGPHRRRT